MTKSAKPERGTLLVTGGGRGIGRAVAELAAQRNWAVAVNYRQNAAAAEAVVQAISERGAQALAIQGDVSSEADVVRVFDVAEQRMGTVTAVVNNAGIVAPVMPLAEASADRFRRLLDVNIYGALLVAREAARRLSTARGGPGGAIVNVSSIAARLGSPGEYVDYAATKAAIDTLTIGLGRELAREGVRVNAVRPGLIETDIHADSGAADRAQRLGKLTPMGRAGQAWEVALAIAWLLSDEAAYVTGTIVDVAGGR